MGRVQDRYASPVQNLLRRCDPGKLIPTVLGHLYEGLDRGVGGFHDAGVGADQEGLPNSRVEQRTPMRDTPGGTRHRPVAATVPVPEPERAAKNLCREGLVEIRKGGAGRDH